MPDDRVRKGQTKLNMFSVLDEQIKSLSSEQSKLNFWNWLNNKFAIFMPFLGTNNHLTTKPSNFDIKCHRNSESYDQHVFFGPISGVFRIFYLRLEVFFNKREYSEADGPDLLISASEQAPGIGFHTWDKSKKVYCGFLGPPYRNKKVDSNRNVSFVWCELLASNIAN